MITSRNMIYVIMSRKNNDFSLNSELFVLFNIYLYEMKFNESLI